MKRWPDAQTVQITPALGAINLHPRNNNGHSSRQYVESTDGRPSGAAKDVHNLLREKLRER